MACTPPRLARPLVLAFLYCLTACCLVSPASAQEGTWKVEGLYEGTGTSTMSSAGNAILSSTVGDLTLTPQTGSFNLGDVTNSPPNTFSGGITAKLPIRVFMEAPGEGDEAHATQTVGGGTIRIKLTWQPKNGDAALDPPPATVRFQYKRFLSVRTDISVEAPDGGYADGRAKGELDAYVKDTELLAIPPPQPPAAESSGLLTDGDAELIEEVLPVSGGVASKTFTVKWTASGNVIGANCPWTGSELLRSALFIPAPAP